jgi:hypothetical protein
MNNDDMPEIEPGMWAVDPYGRQWLAVKPSRHSSELEWVYKDHRLKICELYFYQLCDLVPHPIFQTTLNPIWTRPRTY